MSRIITEIDALQTFRVTLNPNDTRREPVNGDGISTICYQNILVPTLYTRQFATYCETDITLPKSLAGDEHYLALARYVLLSLGVPMRNGTLGVMASGATSAPWLHVLDIKALIDSALKST